MLTRLIALLVLCGVLGVPGVPGQDAPTPVSHTFGLEHVSIHGRITGIVDGDTINVRILGKQQIRVRIAFVDAPEKGQPFGQRAKAAMSELLFGKDVELQAHTIDRHWLLVARVLVDGQDAGFELLKQGLCWVYERYLPEASPDIQASYQQAQAVAREQKFGLWSDPFPVPPWDWRKGEKERSMRYLGRSGLKCISRASVGMLSSIF